MKGFYNMKISGKLLLSFMVVAVILCIVGGVGYYSLEKMRKAEIEISEVRLPSIQSLLKMKEAQNAIDSAENALLNEEVKGNDRTVLYDKITAELKKASDAKAIYDPLEQTSDEAKLWEEFKPAWIKWINDDADYIKLCKTYDSEKSDMLHKKMVEQALVTNTLSLDITAKLLDQVIVINEDVAKQASVDANNTYSAGNRLIAIIVIIGLFMAIGLGLVVSKIISRPIIKLVDYANRLALGDLDIEIINETKDEVGTLMTSFKKMIENIKEQVNAVEKISAGDLNINLKVKSEKDVLSKNLISMVHTIKELLGETNKLIKTTQEGKLDSRGNTALYNGAWSELLGGINKLIDAFVAPINLTAEYVERISKGDIPPKITDTYNGDFNEIKNNLNSCIESINLLVSDTSSLVASAVDGKLSNRADVSKHQGDYKKIVEGVNKTLDAVIEPIKEASEVLQQMSNGNLKVSMKGNYKGDHADIKNALNSTIDSLSSYVTEISEVLDEMSNSNLDLSINNEYKGDFARIKDALNLIIQSYNEVFTEINNAADQVSSGSNQVSDGSQALSQGTTEQASSIEELTASITEVAAQTKQNAVNSSQANELALNAKEGAILGNSRMKDMLKSMEDINESSSNIKKIIKVIDDIAFQTNILALNAAVEAARAGQHGKGFAVVAEEVRNLAARSANAAKETTALIEGSIKKVEFGTKIANNTAESLDQIVAGVTKASTLVGEIAAASNEQATAISQINKGIEQVSDVVQTNSATAEQSAAASEELSSQASMLKNMVGKFRLKKRTYESHDQSYVGIQSNTRQVKNKSLAYREAAATMKNKPRISLTNKDFGKY